MEHKHLDADIYWNACSPSAAPPSLSRRQAPTPRAPTQHGGVCLISFLRPLNKLASIRTWIRHELPVPT